MPFAQYYLLDLIIGQSKATTPATSTPSAITDITLLVKSIATTRNKSTPAAAQRSLRSQVLVQRKLQSLGNFLQLFLFLFPDTVVISYIKTQAKNIDSVIRPGNVSQFAQRLSVG